MNKMLVFAVIILTTHTLLTPTGFPAGTTVKVPAKDQGPEGELICIDVPIESIQPGDIIVCYDTRSPSPVKRLEIGSVQGTIINCQKPAKEPVNAGLSLLANGSELIMHPEQELYFLNSINWLKVRNLFHTYHLYDVLFCMSQKRFCAHNSRISWTEYEGPWYSLEVEPYSNFFVGAEGFLARGRSVWDKRQSGLIQAIY